MSTAQPRAKKSLGQHFLRDKNISEKIVRLLHIAEGDCVLEIGPGPGALTSILETSPLSRLVLLEKDHHWAVERQKKSGPRTQAVLMDALTMTWERITPEAPWKIISNLPYNVASPLMWDIFSRATGLTRAVFMVQKEVGERLAASPDSKDYGGLSVWVQSFVRPQWGFVVGPRAFAPPPRWIQPSCPSPHCPATNGLPNRRCWPHSSKCASKTDANNWVLSSAATGART